MIDDDRCYAEDVGGNLGGPCTCSACRARDEFLESEAHKARARLEETMRAAINVEKTLDKNPNTCTVAISNLDETRVAIKRRTDDTPRFVTVNTERLRVYTFEVRQAALESVARDFAETCPSLYQIMTRQLNPDPRTVERYTAELRRAALKYAAEYLAEERKRDGGDYGEAIEELRDPTIRGLS